MKSVNKEERVRNEGKEIFSRSQHWDRIDNVQLVRVPNYARCA